MGLKELRSRRGMTQVQLAELTGLTQQALSKYEKGITDTGNMTLANALKLADALHCSPGELMES